MKTNKLITILIADDDQDDRLLITNALKQCSVGDIIKTVENGEELINYLHNKGEFENKDQSPKPCLILLDLNMPKIGGREALKKIKSDPELKHIPVIILTTSQAEEDIFKTYDLGVNSFVTKPLTYDSLITKVDTLKKYWFDTVELPENKS